LSDDPSAPLEPGARVRLFSAASEFATLAEISCAAIDALDPAVVGWLESGSGEEWTLRENRRAFDRWTFVPRYQAGNGVAATAVTFLGDRLTAPLLAAPFGMDSVLHPDGVLAVARAHEAMGMGIGISQWCSYSLEQVAEVAPNCPKYLHMPPNGDEARFIAMARRAEAAGFRALLVTVDDAVVAWRDRTLESRFTPDLDAVTGHHRVGGVLDESVVAWMGQLDETTWTWSRLGEVCAAAGLPFVVKGVVTAEDARAAVDIGAAAVWVSNHGGRQLDGVRASLDALPEVAAEVADAVPIVLDSGIRRGTDILKALALGATVVAVGRPIAYGLAAGGADGVERVLGILTEELIRAVTLAGRASVQDVDRSLVQPANGGPR
jgi:isopentenyl diphosphate isomerase/L-lactate dehydrogenase-like FMN-dependent dehydrogenase